MSQVTRDSNGRFAVGNPGGPGRKPREVEKEYLSTMESIVTPARWQNVVEQALTDAEAGDAKARLWLSGYLMGQPIARTQEVEQSNSIDEAIEKMRAVGLGKMIEAGIELD